ncbi:unnamed protein product [Clonostachys byssicola]|uniref:Uncharacterized protein n=1 Tax=Clonostachys byssicola TaxID=160290 RepID=A0A9N9XZX3_9HYPO|nr:unnamed protein product [Clonostachys byssicola]
MASTQPRRSARIAARRKATTSQAASALLESPEHPLQELAMPTAQDVPEAESSSNDQLHVEPASDTLYHRTLWRKTSRMGCVCFFIATFARIVLFMGQRLPRGAYHEISLLNDLLNAAITQSVLSHILTYHDLQPLLAAHKSFRLPIHQSILEYARYHRHSSLIPAGSPWLFSPVARRYLLNSTEHNYTETQFDMVPWVNFHEDLVKVLEIMADDLAWLAKNASTSDLFTGVVNSESWLANSKSTDRMSDSQFSESSTDGSLQMDEAIPWCSVSQSVTCDTQTIRFNSLLYDLNKTISTAVEYWLQPSEHRLNWGILHAGARGMLFVVELDLDFTLNLREEHGIWLSANGSAIPNSDMPRIECLKRHNSSDPVDAFESCDIFIPSTVDFASAQVQNLTAQDMLKLATDASQHMSPTVSEDPETYLLVFKSHLEELKRVTRGLIQHMEDVLFYFDTTKMAEQVHEKAWNEHYRIRIECRLARLKKTLLFLREIALTRLEDQIERVVIALLIVKDVNSQRQHIQETAHSLRSPNSWILPPHPMSSWRGWLCWVVGLTPYTSRRLVFPSLEDMLTDANKASGWVWKLIDYDKFLTEELSKTFEVADNKYGKSYSLLSSSFGGPEQCKNVNLIDFVNHQVEPAEQDLPSDELSEAQPHRLDGDIGAEEQLVGVEDTQVDEDWVNEMEWANLPPFDRLYYNSVRVIADFWESRTPRV